MQVVTENHLVVWHPLIGRLLRGARKTYRTRRLPNQWLVHLYERTWPVGDQMSPAVKSRIVDYHDRSQLFPSPQHRQLPAKTQLELEIY